MSLLVTYHFDHHDETICGREISLMHKKTVKMSHVNCKGCLKLIRQWLRNMPKVKKPEIIYHFKGMKKALCGIFEGDNNKTTDNKKLLTCDDCLRLVEMTDGYRRFVMDKYIREQMNG